MRIPESKAFTDDEVEALTAIANHVLDMLERGEWVDSSEDGEHTIEMTGVPFCERGLGYGSTN